MIYKWINTDSNQSSETFTDNVDYIARLDVFITESNIEQDEQGRFIINDEIRDMILNAASGDTNE